MNKTLVTSLIAGLICSSTYAFAIRPPKVPAASVLRGGRVAAEAANQAAKAVEATSRAVARAAAAATVQRPLCPAAAASVARPGRIQQSIVNVGSRVKTVMPMVRDINAVCKPTVVERSLRPAEKIQESLKAHGTVESQRLAEQYRDARERFVKIKSNMDGFLFYQHLEPQGINPLEMDEKMRELARATLAIKEMERVVGPRDPGVHEATLYVNRVYRLLNPNYAELLVIKDPIKPLEEVSSQQTDHFLLKDADGTSLSHKQFGFGTPASAQAKEMAKELPPMTIAILNDDPEILEWARDWASHGELGPQTRVAVFSTLDKLSDWLTEVKYDVILMDYVLEDGVSLVVVDQLRAAGDDSTVILVNSALEDKEVPVQELMEHGVNGFVSSVGFRPDTGGERLGNALYNYMRIHGKGSLTPHENK